MDGRGLPPRGLTALLSLKEFNLLSPTFFPLYPTYMERRVVTGRSLWHSHGSSASWTWASSPQILEEKQSMAGWAGRAAHCRHQERGDFSKGRGLLLSFCQRPHVHMLFLSWRPTRRCSQELKKYETHWGYQDRLCASAPVQHLTSGSTQYPLYIVQSKMGCHGGRDFYSCWRHSDIYSLSALMSSWYLNLLGLKIPA